MINVEGGGESGQAGAVRHGITRALIDYDAQLKPDAIEGGAGHARRARGRAQEGRPAQGAQAQAVLEALTPGAITLEGRLRGGLRVLRERGPPCRRHNDAGGGARIAPTQDEARMIKIGIVGGTGYTGVELLRLLAAASRGGRARDHVAQGRRARRSPTCSPACADATTLAFSDPAQTRTRRRATWCSSPRRTASRWRRRASWSARASSIIDLAADFRLKDPAVFEQWYGMPHACPDLLAESGLRTAGDQPRGDPARAHRRQSRAAIRPPCSSGFLPLVEAGVVDPEHLIADCKSGVSGAGRKAEMGLHVRRGVGQLQGVRRQGPSPPSGNRAGPRPRRARRRYRWCSRRTSCR